MAGAVAILLTPGSRKQLIRLIALTAALASVVFAVYTFVAYDFGEGGFQFEQQWVWVESLGVTVHWGVDGISVPMVLLTSIVMLTGVIISWNVEERVKDYFVLLMLLVTGVFGTFVALDLFFLFFFYELAVLPMYLLIAVWGSTRKEYGALKLTLYLVGGSVLVWIGILAIYVEAGQGTFDLLALNTAEFSQDFQTIFFPILLIGFGVLAGLWPFHTWSPDGHVAAPTAVSMLHAGVLMKLGAYGIIRVAMPLLPEGADTWQTLFIAFATVNVMYGAFAAMSQRDLKFIIGYSSVGHMGLVLIGLATIDNVGMSGAVLQMFSHGIMTALFFVIAGMIYERAHTRDITVLQGLSHRMAFTTFFFVLAGLASLGMPGTSGFVAEVLVFMGAFRTFPVVGVFGIIAAALTAVYMLRLLSRVFFGPLDDRWRSLTDATPREGIVIAILGGMLILVGLYPEPFMDIINSGVEPLVDALVAAS